MQIFGIVLGSIILATLFDAYLSSVWTMLRVGLLDRKEVIRDAIRYPFFRLRYEWSQLRSLFR